jgi:hypothetical protein
MFGMIRVRERLDELGVTRAFGGERPLEQDLVFPVVAEVVFVAEDVTVVGG